VKGNLHKYLVLLVAGFCLSFYAGYRFRGFVIEAAFVRTVPPGADVIIVLTGDRGRVEKGLRLLRDGLAGTLIISGVHRDAGLDAIFPSGVEPRLRKRIILEKSSKNTYQNAVEARGIVVEKGFKSIVLLTSWYHIKRAEYIFRGVMPKGVVITACAVVAPTPEETSLSNVKGMFMLASEFLKYRWYAAVGV